MNGAKRKFVPDKFDGAEELKKYAPRKVICRRGNLFFCRRRMFLVFMFCC